MNLQKSFGTRYNWHYRANKMNDLLKHIGIRIQEAVEEKNWTSVEHWAKELLKYAPKKALGFKWLARASLAQGKIDRAAYAYNRVLDFESDNEEAQKFFADYARDEITHKPVTFSVDKAETEDSFHILNPEQKNFLGRAEFESGVAYEAVKMFSESADHYKKSFYWFAHPQAAYKAAEMMHKAQRSYEAIKLLRETINVNASWIEGRLLLAQVYFDLGQMTSAQNEWQAALKLDPRNQEALKKLRSTWEMSVESDR
jgi:tetratricopeptide (TPR) repeat protein